MSVHLRKPNEEDIERFKVCLLDDPDHRLQNVEDWTEGPGEFMVFYDAKGNRMWVKLERVLRVNIQHDPATDWKHRVVLLYKSFAWLQGAARKSHHAEVIFESRAPRLIQFLQKLFGVKPVENNFHVRTI